MLYKLGKAANKFSSIEPLPFSGVSLEKELEDLLAHYLLDVLFEGNPMLPILQERSRQAEADIYALNERGDLTIFELKRNQAGTGAVHQALRYAEEASRWGYEQIQLQLRKYQMNDALDLQEEHRLAFDLEHALDRSCFNRNQHLIIVGIAGDNALIRNVDYWKNKGISINFSPYRVYTISGEPYLEFFSLPYDQHSNPGDRKGVIFDTNLAYDEDGLWYMCEKDRVAAFGSIKDVVTRFRKGDTAFLFHKGYGIVAAGRVKGGVKEDSKENAMYRDLEWLTLKPVRGTPLKAMSVPAIKRATGRNFWWAKTMKVPYLDQDESTELLTALKDALS
jgi:hypothetical protein